MKKFDLDSVQLVDLNDVELEELGEYLMTLGIRVCVDFLVYIMDTQYILGENSYYDSKMHRQYPSLQVPLIVLISSTRKFMAHNRFIKCRDLIYRYDEISEQEWVKLDYKFRCGLRRSKLEQLGRSSNLNGSSDMRSNNRMEVYEGTVIYM